MTDSWRTKLAKFLAGDQWPVKNDTSVGVSNFEPLVMARWRRSFGDPSRDRLQAYDDVEQMEETNEDVAAALDVLADNVVNPDKNGESKFTVVYTPRADVDESVKRTIDDLVERTRLREKVYSFTRELLLYGDLFVEYVINSNFEITRLMYLPPNTMIRNEDEKGRLLPGNTEESSAFTQVEPGTNNPVAYFYWWQVEHVRWNRRGNDKYGRSLLYTARTSWRKLRAMEEAVVINWLTRAFSRLAFVVDVTHKSPAEAVLEIDNFRKSLQTQKIASGVEGTDSLTVVKDIFIGNSYREIGGKVQPGLNDVKVLDTTSTAFWNLEAVRYFQQKILTALRVPKAHIGLEKDINAKSTLVLQDKRFARTIRRVQDVVGELIRHTIELQLKLVGINPKSVPFEIMWPSPAWMDATDEATFYLNIAKAAQILIPLGIIDAEYVALQMLRMPPAVRELIKKNIEANGIPLPPRAAQGGVGPQGGNMDDNQRS